MIKRFNHPYESPYTKPIEYKIDDNGCWNFINRYKNPDGYGKIELGPRTYEVRYNLHRFVYGVVNGMKTIEDSKIFIRHKCDNPGCINPNHLEPGSHADNMNDMAVRDRSQKNNKNHSKITQEIADKIRADERPYRILTEVYGMCKSSISYIKNNKTWK